MKTLFTTIASILMMLAVSLYAQTDYLVSAKNGVLTDDYNFEFDIYIQSTGSTQLELATFQTSIYFNDTITNGGVLSVAYIQGTCELSDSTQFPNTPNISFIANSGTIRQFRIATKIPPGAGNGSVISDIEPGTRFGRFRITNSVPFNKNVPVSWQWNFTTGLGEYSSYINGYLNSLNTNITDLLSFEIDLPDPLTQIATFQISVHLENGWNMVSVPGLHPVDQNVNNWWSGKDPAANVFGFQSGYQAVTTVQPGFGYWMKHLGANTYNTGDEWPAGGINIVPHDPINAAAGWNLIGGYEFLAPTAALTTNPSGLISGLIYGYTSGTGYNVASVLVPGYGYWVKLTAGGQININPGPKANFKFADWIGENAGKIIITDNAGKSYTLYVANDSKTSLDYFELPPVPFTDMFDVRYTSGRFVEELSSAIKTIQLQGVEYPVKVRVEGMMIRISDESGKVVNERIKSGEEVTISNPSVSKLNVMSDIIPDKYSLEQNYPNPFNPTTTIEFTLPEDVENVRLTIYNALGEKVAELVNGKMEAGRYRYQWNAGNVATGLYIYQIKAKDFVSTKKMMLLK